MTTALAIPHAHATRDAVLRVEDLVRDFGKGDGVVRALDGVTLGFARGSFIAVMGPSGSGKSTLLQSAAGLDRPSSGQVYLGDQELGALGERALARIRRERVGFVFQSFNLLAALTAAQNVALPSRLAGRRLHRGAVQEALARVGLADRAGHRTVREPDAGERLLHRAAMQAAAGEPRGQRDVLRGRQHRAVERLKDEADPLTPESGPTRRPSS